MLMPRLNCSAMNCDYNDNGFCTTANITIEGMEADNKSDTYCSTYIDTDGVIGLRNEYSNYMMGMVQGFSSSAFEGNIMSPYIQCNVHTCHYNLDGVCMARDVNIYGESQGQLGTECNTFIRR